MTLELEVKAVHEQKFQVELDLSRKASELLSLRKKLDADVDQQQRQYDKLHKLWSGQDSSQSSLAQQLTTTQGELETANIRISFLSEKFTDLNFEKSKIEAIYNDNLVLHDRQKDAQKTLMIQISTLNEQLEQAHRTIELTNKTSQHQLDKLAKEKAQVETLLRKREAALKKKEGFVHPMLLEDALETLKR
jgi:chromosome segregation ATPase